MLIALLAVLGVNLAVIVALVAGLVARRRWLRRQSGAFAGALRHAAGEKLPGTRDRWRRGYGRWVRDVLVWNPGPLCIRTLLVPVDSLSPRGALPGEVKRMGDAPIVVTYAAGELRLEIATDSATVPLALGRSGALESPGPDEAAAHRVGLAWDRRSIEEAIDE